MPRGWRKHSMSSSGNMSVPGKAGRGGSLPGLLRRELPGKEVRYGSHDPNRAVGWDACRVGTLCGVGGRATGGGEAAGAGLSVGGTRWNRWHADDWRDMWGSPSQPVGDGVGGGESA